MLSMRGCGFGPLVFVRRDFDWEEASGEEEKVAARRSDAELRRRGGGEAAVVGLRLGFGGRFGLRWGDLAVGN